MTAESFWDDRQATGQSAFAKAMADKAV